MVLALFTGFFLGRPNAKTSSHVIYLQTKQFLYSSFFKKWKTTTKLSVNTLLDWRGEDPDVIATGYDTNQSDFTLQLNHEGKLALNLPLCRTLSYVAGFSTSRKETTTSKIVTSLSNLIPIINATHTGYYDIPFQSGSYFASGGTLSTPQSLFFKVTNTFGAHIGKFTQQFKIGRAHV